MRPGLDDLDAAGYGVEPFAELDGQQPAKQGPNRHAGIIIPTFPNSATRPLVVSKIWTVKRYFHKTAEGNRSVGPYFLADEPLDICVGGHIWAVAPPAVSLLLS